MPKRSFFSGPEAFFLLFGGIWMLVGVPFFLAGLSLLAHQLHANRRFAAEGKVVPGVVVEKFTRRSGSNTRYAIRYRFTPAGGREATAVADLDSDAWEELSENSTIPVTYLESDRGFAMSPARTARWSCRWYSRPLARSSAAWEP